MERKNIHSQNYVNFCVISSGKCEIAGIFVRIKQFARDAINGAIKNNLIFKREDLIKIAYLF